MITTRAKIAAAGAALIAGAGLTLAMLTGNAAATTPSHSTVTAPPAGITKTSAVGAGVSTADPNGPRPTATVFATPPATSAGH